MKWRNKLCVWLLALVFILTPGLALGQEFTDIEGHWAQENMVRALELKWIQGEGNGKLSPGREMSRAEFITMAYRTLGLDGLNLEKETSYQDLDSLDWAKDTLKRADQAGILSLAFPGNTLNPTAPMSREEAVVLLDHVINLKGALTKSEDSKETVDLIRDFMAEKAKTGESTTSLSFKDQDQIQGPFRASVRDLSQRKLVKGYDGNLFGPKDSLSRAQGVTFLLRALGQEPKSLDLTEVKVMEEDGVFYLFDSQGERKVLYSQTQNGRIKVKDQVYLLNPDGSLKKGFFQENGESYYANGEKGLSRGWKEVDGKLYYFSPMDYRMYKDGIFSTGKNVHWFDKDGVVREGTRRGGYKKLPVYWHYPSKEELTNSWLEGPDQELRFRGQEIANFAASFEGWPFHWYGTDLRNPAGVYCCGNVYSAYKEFGIRVPGPNDVDMKKHKGYEMVRAQYQDCEKYGGHKVPADFDQIWPGDLVFVHSPNFYLGFNHVGIYMGKNGNTPYYIHSAIENGLSIESPYKMIKERNRIFNKNFIRYNTAANPGNGKIPKK